MVIQRGWKILSDAGSTSASSTEANRSPTGLNSSSDDSNCSNQTTHSMVTSASPVSNHHKLETTTSLNTNSNTTNNTNNSDTMKYVTTPQMAEMTLQKIRQRFSSTTLMTSSSAESGMRSLELVRIAVQSAFDKEIDELVKRYIETYFKPAFNNIKENLGQGAINEDALQKMCCALLENSKTQYKTTFRYKSQSSTTIPISSTLSTVSNGQENNTIRMALKRPAPTKPTTATVIEIQKRFFPDNMLIRTANPSQPQNSTQILPVVGTLIQSQSTAFVQQSPQMQQPQPLQQLQKIPPNIVGPQPRRQIFWNTAHISTTTKFVLDVQANQAFGFGTEGKERRLASKHPELIRYLPDNEDRDWLVTQQIIPQPNRNSRFLFLIYDEVCRLYQTHEVYKNKTSIDLSVMMTFTVPDFMIQKMKIFFVDLNIKSRGLITNSYSIGNGLNPSSAQSNSHLRNALLLGTSQGSTTVPAVSSPSSTAVATSSNSDVTSNLHMGQTPSTSSPSSNISSTEGLLHQPQLQQPKSKSSNLSSSHATLTALLNNSSSSTTTPSTSDKSSNNSANLSPSTLASSAPTLLNKLRK
ncbi:uncharacterized protein [Musca autumnalis]|uniref:uncharacterized protein n=1 Tax=Musca autumnalis TaxID=221902 RepID=UPI003CE67AEC